MYKFWNQIKTFETLLLLFIACGRCSTLVRHSNTIVNNMVKVDLGRLFS